MKIKIINAILRVNYLLLIMAMISAVSYGQKTTAIDRAEAARQESFQIEREAREELSRSPLALSLLDLIKANASAWRLEKAAYSAKRESSDSAGIQLVYTKGKVKVPFSIYEFDTLKAPKDVYNIGRSAGNAVEYNRFGDRGEKIYGDGKIFWMLTFNIDRFRVLIVARKEKNAERFAALIEKAIKELIRTEQEKNGLKNGVS